MNADEIKKALFEASEICGQKCCEDCPFVKIDELRCPIYGSWPCYWEVSDWGGFEVANLPVPNKKGNKKGWMSVKDRLPPSEEEVLVYTLWGSFDIALYRDGEWVSDLIGSYDDDDVTHWQPLSEPPKEKNDE